MQYISVYSQEEDSGHDHGGCIKLLYNRIILRDTKSDMNEDESTNQKSSASEFRLWVSQGADEASANHHNGSST